MKFNMASRSAIETWLGFETVSKQRLAHTQPRLYTNSAESLFSRFSVGRVTDSRKLQVFFFSLHQAKFTKEIW